MAMLTRAILAGLLLAAPVAASAQLRVFACEPEWAALAEEVGGSLVEIGARDEAERTHPVAAFREKPSPPEARRLFESGALANCLILVAAVRDFLGRSFYGYFHPLSYLAREKNSYSLIVVDLVTLRAELLPFDQQIEEAADPYVLIRDVYLQNREFKIYDGDPPAPDYDALLEDF